MTNIITPDKFFSIWIFIYTIAYIFKIVPYNPIILIYIALTFFVFSLFIIIYYLNENSLLFYYIMINTIAKIIPLFIIINNKITYNDIIFTVYFILLYVIYMQIIKEDIICVYRDYIKFIIDKDKGRESSFYNIYIQLQNKLKIIFATVYI
jgi:hypothetical protein